MSLESLYNKIASLEARINELENNQNTSLLNKEEACKILGCTTHTLAFYRSKKGLPFIFGKPHKYEKEKILQWQSDNINLFRTKTK